MATTERSTIVRLQAEISGFKRGMAEASKAAAETASSASKNFGSTNSALGTLIQTSKRYPESWNQIAGASLKAGLAVTAGIGLTVKAAMDWESAWTGVKKTVDGTPEQLASVEAGLRNLSKTLPTSNIQIAAVAEAAGQLGVKTGDVVAFTKTMIDMGESTNLSAEEAATAIARFTNVMGTVDRIGASAYNKVGAAIVGLGNNFATTEAEILQMAQRLSSAGRSANFTEGDILGLAAAMSSVGIEAEAGGTAMTMVMNKIGRAVDTGSKQLDSFARIAGMSADDFSKKWKTAPAQALQSVVEGLGKAQAGGQSMVQMLDELGIKGIREANSMRSLANASGILGDAIAQGNREFDSGSALIEEASKRYETAESKVRIAWNSIKDSSIDVGSALLPVVAGISQGISGMADAFGSLPETVKSSIGVIGAFAGIGLLAVGGGMKLITTVVETKAAFDTLRASGGQLPGVLGKIGKAAGVAALGIGGLAILGQALTQKNAADASDYAAALAKVANNANELSGLDTPFQKWDRTFGQTNADLSGIEESIKRISSPQQSDGVNQWADQAFAWTGFAQSETTQIKDRLKELSGVMGDMASNGQAEQAAASFNLLSSEFEKNGKSAQDALNYLPGYKKALEGIATAAGVTLTEQELLDLAMGKIPAKLSAATIAADGTSTALEGMGGAAIEAAGAISKEIAKALDDLGVSVDGSITSMTNFIKTLSGMSGGILSVRDAVRSQIEAQTAFDESLAKNGTSMDISTKQGLANQKAFDAVAQAGWKTVESMAAATDANGRLKYSQEEIQQQLVNNYDQFIANANKAGIYGQEADTLARKILNIPNDVNVKTWMSDQAKRLAEQTKGAVEDIPDKNVEVRANTNPFWDAIGNITGKALSTVVDIFAGGAAGKANGGAIGFMAGGGGIYGPGTGTSDTAGLYALSNGEHVLTASDVTALGGQRAVYDLRRGLQSKTFAAQSAPVSTASGAGSSMELTGNLFLDSGEFLGKVTGVAVKVASAGDASIESKLARAGVRLGS